MKSQLRTVLLSGVLGILITLTLIIGFIKRGIFGLGGGGEFSPVLFFLLLFVWGPPIIGFCIGIGLILKKIFVK